MISRYIFTFLGSLILFGSDLGARHPLPSEMLEAGDLCTFEAMKMVWTHKVEEPLTPLDAASIFKHESTDQGKMFGLSFKDLNTEVIVRQSHGFSQAFLTQVIHYVGLFQSGMSADQIRAAESPQDPGRTTDSDGTAGSLALQLAALFCQGQDSHAYEAPSLDVANSAFVKPNEGGGALKDSVDAASLQSLFSQEFFDQDSLEDTFQDSLLVLSAKNPPPNPPASGPGGQENSFLDASSIFFQSFENLAQHYHRASLRESSASLTQFEEEEAPITSGSSLLKPLLETPVMLILSYLASMVVLMMGSFVDLRLGSFILGWRPSRGLMQVSSLSHSLKASLEEWAVTIGLLPQKALIRRF